MAAVILRSSWKCLCKSRFVMILEFLTLDVVQFSCKWQSTLSRLVAKCYDVKGEEFMKAQAK